MLRIDSANTPLLYGNILNEIYYLPIGYNKDDEELMQKKENWLLSMTYCANFDRLNWKIKKPIE
jgi:hypothetical protein